MSNDVGSEGGLSVGSIGVVSPNESVVVLSEAKGDRMSVKEWTGDRLANETHLGLTDRAAFSDDVSDGAAERSHGPLSINGLLLHVCELLVHNGLFSDQVVGGLLRLRGSGKGGRHEGQSNVQMSEARTRRRTLFLLEMSFWRLLISLAFCAALWLTGRARRRL